MHIDRTRSHAAKARSVTRKAERRAASTRRFLALAFPADLSGFLPSDAR